MSKRSPAKAPRRRGRPKRVPPRQAAEIRVHPDVPPLQRLGIASDREPVGLLSDKQAAELARRCRVAALDKKGEGVVMLDIRSRANFADYFVIATGRSVLQARAIADGVVEATELDYGAPLRTEGYNDGSWILLDYGPVIVHVFTPPARQFYDLERLWGKPPKKPRAPARNGFAGRRKG